VKTKDSKNLSDILREKGYRLTPQRMLVLEAIEATNDHISAEEIYRQARAKYRYINISTVYRAVELLKELGLVTETDLGSGRLLYHPASKARHHHLVCRKCGKALDIDASVVQRLKEELKAKYSFDAELEHMAIFGTCERCRS